MSEPREWTLQWVEQDCRWQIISWSVGNEKERKAISPPFVSVIDYQAYQREKSARERLQRALVAVSLGHTIVKWNGKFDEYGFCQRVEEKLITPETEAARQALSDAEDILDGKKGDGV